MYTLCTIYLLIWHTSDSKSGLLLLWCFTLLIRNVYVTYYFPVGDVLYYFIYWASHNTCYVTALLRLVAPDLRLALSIAVNSLSLQLQVTYTRLAYACPLYMCFWHHLLSKSPPVALSRITSAAFSTSFLPLFNPTLCLFSTSFQPHFPPLFYLLSTPFSPSFHLSWPFQKTKTVPCFNALLINVFCMGRVGCGDWFRITQLRSYFELGAEFVSTVPDRERKQRLCLPADHAYMPYLYVSLCDSLGQSQVAHCSSFGWCGVRTGVDLPERDDVRILLLKVVRLYGLTAVVTR